MNEPVVMAVVIVLAAVGGLLVGFLARGLVANQAIKSATEKSERIVAEARAQQKELILQAKEEQVRIQREARDGNGWRNGHYNGQYNNAGWSDRDRDGRDDRYEDDRGYDRD